MKNLHNFNQRGWIPGPDEEKKEFEKRIEKLDYFYSHPPHDVDHFLTESDWMGARETTLRLLDFSPDWIIAHYSNKNLPFFQGAATWILEKENIRIPLIQLKEKLEYGSLFRLYRRDEILAHEAVHAARMQFDEPKFEEIFAYQSSTKWWRRFFGPLFQKPYETYLLLVLLFFPLCIEIARLFGYENAYFPFLTYLPAVYLGFLLLRLLFFRITLFFALKKITHFLKNPSKKWAFALRLKDKEIFQFAYFSKPKLIDTLLQQTSFRWEFLKKEYL